MVGTKLILTFVDEKKGTFKLVIFQENEAFQLKIELITL